MLSKGGYAVLKGTAFVVGTLIIIFLVYYVARRRNPDLRGQRTLSRRSWYSDDPRGARLSEERPPCGEKPGWWEVWAASCHPLCPRHGSRSGKLGLGQGKDNGRDANCAVTDENGPVWRELLFLSADKVSDAVPRPLVNGGRPIQHTSTQIRISTIILMPTPPRRPTSFFSTSSNNTGDNANQYTSSQREYVLGTSYLPYTPDC